MEESEIRMIAKSIVDKAKATARVDQGTLKRSIAYTYVRGEVIFRQIYYGSFGDNSLLEDLARQYMPFGVPYRVILTELGGDTYEKGKTKQGRSTQKRALTAAKNTTSNIKKLIATIKKKREKEDGKEEE